MPSRTDSSLKTVYNLYAYSARGGYPDNWNSEYGGLVGTSVEVTHSPNVSRRRPAAFGTRNGTSLSVTTKTYVNPLIRGVRRMEYSDLHYKTSAMTLDPGVIPVPSELDSLSNELNAKLLLKIKSQNINLAVSLAEFRSTANTVGSLASSIAKVLVQPKMRRGLYLARQLQRGLPHYRWSNRVQTLKSTRDKEACNSYLAYTYGLSPIMSDITGSLQALSERLLNQELIRKEKVSATREQFAIGRGKYGDSMSRRVTKFSLRAEYRVNTAVQALSKVGITNPASAVYELIPYSFVFDWIIPVGDYLATLDALTGVDNFVYVERYLDVLSQATSSGYQQNETSKVRSAPLTRTPSVRLTYTPSASLNAVQNGIMLLKQLR